VSAADDADDDVADAELGGRGEPWHKLSLVLSLRPAPEARVFFTSSSYVIAALRKGNAPPLLCPFISVTEKSVKKKKKRKKKVIHRSCIDYCSPSPIFFCSLRGKLPLLSTLFPRRLKRETAKGQSTGDLMIIIYVYE
jgi:hypothetical protein